MVLSNISILSEPCPLAKAPGGTESGLVLMLGSGVLWAPGCTKFPRRSGLGTLTAFAFLILWTSIGTCGPWKRAWFNGWWSVTIACVLIHSTCDTFLFWYFFILTILDKVKSGEQGCVQPSFVVVLLEQGCVEVIDLFLRKQSINQRYVTTNALI